MPKSTPYHLDSGPLDRLNTELQEENQRIKDACFQVTRIDPDAEPRRYEVLVSAMLTALDQRAALDGEAGDGEPVSVQADPFEGIELESEALYTLIDQLRGLSSGSAQSSDRYVVLNNYVKSNLAEGGVRRAVDTRRAPIDWEDLAARMDALRERLNREATEDGERSDGSRKAARSQASTATSAQTGDTQ